MLGRRIYAVAMVFATLWVADNSVVQSQAQQTELAKGTMRQNFRPGRRIFTSTCAGCHGLDGRGGERGPNITGSVAVGRLTDAQISGIVRNGVPGTGMPAFRSLGMSEVRDVVSYLRLLQGQNTAQAIPGSATRGNAVFFGKAECSSCHMVQGKGGFLGADLSTYGSGRSGKEILDAIVDPAKNADAGKKSIVVVTRDGHRLSGLVRNQDNFSLQLLTREGEFYFLEKADLESLQYQDHSLMPSDYGERLSGRELNDLASYLMSVGRPAEPSRPAGREED
jgi:cytochrome c oxidase cbb3-type subunit 3